MTELIPGKRYRVAVEGIARDANLLSLGEGVALYSNVLNLATSIELLPDPLPTTPGSVVLDRDETPWTLDESTTAPRWWKVGGTSRFPWALADSWGPFIVLFDAGAKK